MGLSLALGLARYGVGSVILEADDTVCFGSRAVCISRRSLEIIQRLGALDEVLGKGLPWTRGRSYYRTAEVLRFSMPQDENQKLPPMVNIAQYDLEQIFLNAAERLPELIEIRWQSKLTGLTRHDDHATLDIETPEGNYALDASWIVACDGGRSTVRELLDLKLEGTTYEGRYVIVDIALNSALPTERLAFFDPACNRGSTVLVHKQPDGIWRIDYQLRDDEDGEQAIAAERVLPRVQSVLDMMGITATWSPVWISLYRTNARTLESYRHGPVLFAGDAAHLLPIFGVRGANSGLDDADNLAWKLGLVANGSANPALLETYSDERVYAAHENLRYASKSTEFMAPPSAAFKLMRDAVLSLAIAHPPLRSLINPRQSNAIPYSGSPLNVPDEEGNDAFTAGPGAGAPLLECPGTLIAQDNKRKLHLTDTLGTGFTLFHFGEDHKQPDKVTTIAEHFADRRIPLKVVAITRSSTCAPDTTVFWDETGRLFPLYGARSGTAYLIRPDGYVSARFLDVESAANTSLDVDAILDRVSPAITTFA